MRLVYLSNYYDSGDLRYKFGLGAFITRGIAKHTAEIIPVFSKPPAIEFVFKAKQAYYKYLFGKRHLRHREKNFLRNLSSKYEKWIDVLQPDAVYSFGSLPIAYLKTKKKCFFCTDTPFAGIHNYYNEFSNLTKSSIQNAYEIEKLAYEKASFAILPSEWAKKLAVEKHYANPDKIFVLPYGPNFIEAPESDLVGKLIQSRFDNMQKCKLLFIGYDWKRKGADIAFETTKILNERGLPAEISFIGCNPEFNEQIPNYVKIHGYFNKTNPDELNKFFEILYESHFLILPSRADTFGQVFCEASAYGIPSLAFDLMGVSSAVRNEANGYLFSANSTARNFAEKIIEIFNERNSYKSLCQSSRNEYETRLNWDYFGENVINISKHFI